MKLLFFMFFLLTEKLIMVYWGKLNKWLNKKGWPKTVLNSWGCGFTFLTITFPCEFGHNQKQEKQVEESKK